MVFLDVWKDRAPAKRFGIRAIPTQIFFDKDGQGGLPARGVSERGGDRPPVQGYGRKIERTAMLTQFFLTINDWITGRDLPGGPGLLFVGHGQRPVEPLPSGLHPAGRGLCGRTGAGAQAPAGRPLRHLLYRGAVHHDRRDRRRLRAPGTDARGCGQLLADRCRPGSDLGRPGDAGGGKVHPLRQPGCTV